MRPSAFVKYHITHRSSKKETPTIRRESLGDLERAIADTEGGGDEPSGDPPAKKKVARQSTDDGDDPPAPGEKKRTFNDDGRTDTENSALVKALKAIGIDDDDDEPEETEVKPKPKKKKKEGEEEEEIEEEEEVEELEAIELPPGLIGPAVKEKFKRLNTERSKLHKDLQKVKGEAKKKDTEIVELKAKVEAGGSATDVKESKEYKDLLAKVKDQEQVIGQVALEHSEEFQTEYVQPEVKKVNRIGHYLKQIDDADKKKEVVAALDAALSIPLGEENDPAFFKRVKLALTDVDGFIVDGVRPLLADLRELRLARQQKLAEWKPTQQEYLKKNGDERVKSGERALNVFKGVVTEFENLNKDRNARFRSQKDLFLYDETVGPEVEKMAEALQTAIKTGEVKKELAMGLRYGAEATFLSAQNMRLTGWLKEIVTENKLLKKKLKIEDNADPGKGGRPPSKKVGEKDAPKTSGSALVDSLRQVMDQEEE